MFPAAVKLSQVNQGSLEMYAHAAASPFQNQEAAPFWSRELHWGHNTGGDGNWSAWLAVNTMVLRTRPLPGLPDSTTNPEKRDVHPHFCPVPSGLLVEPQQ